MKLKFLSVVLGSLVCSSAFASKASFSGFYVGVRAGGLATHAKIQNDTSATFLLEQLFLPPNTFATLSSSSSNNVWNNTVDANVFVGYGQFVRNSNIYLGGEVFANYANYNGATLNASSVTNEPNFPTFQVVALQTSTEVKLLPVELGIDFRPGYLLDQNTLVYGRVGLALNREKITSTDSFTYTNTFNGITATNQLVSSNARNVLGLRLGIGAEHRFKNHLAATIDYIYTDYVRVATSGSGNLDYFTANEGPDERFVPNGLNTIAGGSLSTHTVMLGLKYYFC